MVTKSALVEQAYSLNKYEIDSVESYDALFESDNNGGAVTAGTSSIRTSLFTNRLFRSVVSETKKNRILRHHSKIMKMKKANLQRSSSSTSSATSTMGATSPSGTANTTTSATTISRSDGLNVAAVLSPPPKLVAALRHIYENAEGSSNVAGDSSTLRSLLESVMDYPAFKETEDSANWVVSSSVEYDEIAGGESSSTYALESLIAHLCEETTKESTSSSVSPTLEHGILIAILSFLMGYQGRAEGERKGEQKNHPKQQQQQQQDSDDPTTIPPLQVGAVLSLLDIEQDNSTDNPWSLDEELILYLGQAAAVYEERIEIQKARLLRRLEEDKRKAELKDKEDPEGVLSEKTGDMTPLPTSAPAPVETSGQSSGQATPAPTVTTPQPGETPLTPGTPDVIATEIRQEDIEASAAALSAAVFEQIVSAATGEESSSNDDEENEGTASFENNNNRVWHEKITTRGR